jgi:hypothetical protein
MSTTESYQNQSRQRKCGKDGGSEDAREEAKRNALEGRTTHASGRGATKQEKG